MDPFLQAAIDEAKKGLAAGGIPIGSVLVCDGKIIGRGHNQRVQHGSVIHHGEMNALENAGRQPAKVYGRCTIYTTLSPCPMCSGAIKLYKIPHVVVGVHGRRGTSAFARREGGRFEQRGMHPDDEGFHHGQTAVVERGHRGVKNKFQPQMDTVCISKSDFNKLAKTIDITMQIRPNSSLFPITFCCFH